MTAFCLNQPDGRYSLLLGGRPNQDWNRGKLQAVFPLRPDMNGPCANMPVIGRHRKPNTNRRDICVFLLPLHAGSCKCHVLREFTLVDPIHTGSFERDSVRYVDSSNGNVRGQAHRARIATIVIGQTMTAITSPRRMRISRDLHPINASCRPTLTGYRINATRDALQGNGRSFTCRLHLNLWDEPR